MERSTAFLLVFAVFVVANYVGAQRNRIPRISELKCIEYSKFVFENISNPTMFNDEDENYDEEVEVKVQYRLNSLCGHTSVPLIVGGEPAKAKEFPHQALIGFERSLNYHDYLCGGSLISEQYIISVAHCKYHRDFKIAKYAVLGDVSRKGPQEKSYQFEIIDRIFHPSYKYPSIENDIALFKLDQALKLETYKGYIRPICLPQTNINYVPPAQRRTSEGKVIATGFGSTGFGEQITENLQKVTLTLFNQSECQNVYRQDSNVPNGFKRRIMICAGSNESSGKDTCGGDSGGPLQIYNTDPNIYCMYTIIGLTSMGQQNCGVAPAIYTKVFHYLSWIENIVWNNSL